MVKLKYLIILIIVSVSFVFDPGIYRSYHTPKNLLLIILIPFCLLLFCFAAVCKAKGFLTRRLVRNDNCEVPQSVSLFRKHTKSSKEFYLNFSIIEILLLTRFIWLIITNPEFLKHPSDLEFWILLSLIFLTFLTRQVFLNSTNKKKFFVILFRSIWLTGLLQAFIGFYQFYSFNNISSQFMKTPIIGLIGSANGYGIFASIGIIAGLIDFVIQEKRKSKIIILFFILLMPVSLFLNGSRGALFALVCSLSITLILFYYKNHTWELKVFTLFTKKIVIPAFFVFIIVGFGVWISGLNWESTKGRFMIWEISAPMFSNNLIFGVGQNHYSIEYLNYQADYFHNKNNLTYSYKAANLKQAHNEFIQAFCESGTAGGIIFLIICIYPLYLLLQKIISNHSEDRIFYYGLFAIQLVILIHSLVDSPLHVLPVSVIFYIILGLIPAKNLKFKLDKRKWIMLLILLSLYIIFIGDKAVRQYSGYYYWEKGVERTQKYLWKDAIENYDIALRKLPEKGELEFHLGSAMVMNQDYIKGINFLNKSLNNFNDRNIYLSLSFAYLRINKYNLAEKFSKIALSMFPDHLAPHLLFGEIYYRLGKIEKSKSSLIKCINQETHFHSFNTYQIAKNAEQLWSKFYGNYHLY